ncbi:MAG: hypothetical protein KME11_00315 [Timaviella obliquedivisa GSE-PSE-MK23-08B]|jgi:hypothetical protein|nr:hypothetical protein [Timaviella obliquedivisa GSE-PSE-MK23-08B]
MSHPRRPDHQSRIAKSTIAAIFTLSISSAFLGVSIISYTVMRSGENLEIEQIHMHNLSTAQQLWVTGNFLGCIAEANKILDGSSYTKAQSIKKDCEKGLAWKELNLVQQLRREGKQEEAIKRVAPLVTIDAEAKKIMEEIASGLLRAGQLHYQKRSPDYYNHAIYPIFAIPSVSDSYNTAQTLLKQWHQEYHNNSEHILAAEAALAQENVSQTQQALQQVTTHPYWQDQAAAIRQEMEILVIYQTAETFMERREWENAIAEATKLPNTPPWAERRSNLISRAEATIQRKEICKTATLGLWQKCYL